MTQVDASIPLSIKQFQPITPVDPAQNTMNAQNIIQGMQKIQENNLKLSAAQQDAKDNALASSVLKTLTPEEAKDPDKVAEKLRSAGVSPQRTLELQSSYQGVAAAKTKQTLDGYKILEEQNKAFDGAQQRGKDAMLDVHEKIATVLNDTYDVYESSLKNGHNDKNAKVAAAATEKGHLQAYIDEIDSRLNNKNNPPNQEQSTMLQNEKKVFAGRLEGLNKTGFDPEEAKTGRMVSSEFLKRNKVQSDIAETQLREAQAREADAKARKADTDAKNSAAGNASLSDRGRGVVSILSTEFPNTMRASKVGMADRNATIERLIQDNPEKSDKEIAKMFVDNQGEAKASIATEIAFAKGKQGDIVRSLNVAVQHLKQMDSTIDGLSNVDERTVNKIFNGVIKEFGGSSGTNLDADAQVVAGEINKATGGSVSVAEIEEVKKLFAKANSKDQLHDAVEHFRGLMAGQLKGLGEQYVSNTGKGWDAFLKKLDPETKKALHLKEDNKPTVSNW